MSSYKEVKRVFFCDEWEDLEKVHKEIIYNNFGDKSLRSVKTFKQTCDVTEFDHIEESAGIRTTNIYHLHNIKIDGKVTIYLQLNSTKHEFV